MHSILETPGYLEDAREAELTDVERDRVIAVLTINPMAGDVIPGTGGARKIRFAGKGRGKSGGYRVITYYGGKDIPLFLLNVFSKGDRADLSMAQRNLLRRELAGLADDYRKGVREYVERR